MSDDPGFEISVVIVTYESEKEIALCLESVFRELEKRLFEVIIVDNASRDQTRIVVNNYASQSNGSVIQLIANDRNIGFTTALNQGLKCSTGKKILVLNPDTELLHTSFAILSETLGTNECAVVAPQLQNPDGSIQPSCRRFPRRRDVLFEVSGLSFIFDKSKIFNHWKMGDFDHDKPAVVDQPQGACLLFKRQVLEQVGLWDEKFPMFFSDVDWCKRVKLAHYQIRFQPEAQVAHRRGVSVRKNRARMILSSHLSFYLYFKKYHHGMINSVLNYSIGFVLLITGFLRAAFTVFASHSDADDV